MNPAEDGEDIMSLSSRSHGAWTGASGLVGDDEGVMSVSEWSQMIEALETQTNATKSAIQDVLVGHLPNDASTFACSQQASLDLSKLRGDLVGMMQQASAPEALEGTVALRETEKNHVLSQLQRLDSNVKILEKLQEVQTALEDLDGLIERNCLKEAAIASCDAEEKISTLGRTGDEFADSKVYRALRVQLRRKKAKLRISAEEVVSSAVFIEPRVLKLHAMGEVSKSKNALEALDALGAVKSALGNGGLGASILRHIVLPAAQMPWLRVEATIKSDLIEISLQGAEPEGSEHTEVARVFENTVQVMRFVTKYLLDDNIQWIRMLATTVWGTPDTKRIGKDVEERLFSKRGADQEQTKSVDSEIELLSSALLQVLIESLPNDIAGLKEYTALQTAARGMEDALVDLGLVSSSTRVVAPFLDDLEVHLSQKRRASLLFSARNLILSDYFSSLTASSAEAQLCNGDALYADLMSTTSKANAYSEGLFKLEPMRVTTCAQEIVNLAVTAMNEAARASHDRLEVEENRGVQLATVLYETARDIFELFRVLVPMRYADELKSPLSPRVALLYHNDCLYMSHHLVLLGFGYRAKFATTMADKIVTVDLVPIMRESAKTHLSSQINQQIRQFAQSVWFENLPSAAGGALSTQEAVALVAQRSVRASDTFKVLFKEWNQILPRSVFNETIVHLANAILGQCVDLVCTKLGRPSDTMPLNEVTALGQTLQQFKDVIQACLVSSSEGSHNTTSIDVSVPKLVTLTQLCSALEQSLSLHILRDLVSQGVLSSLSPAEVKGIAGILFPNETY